MKQSLRLSPAPAESENSEWQLAPEGGESLAERWFPFWVIRWLELVLILVVVQSIMRGTRSDHSGATYALLINIQSHVTPGVNSMDRFRGRQDQMVIAAVFVVHSNSEHPSKGWLGGMAITEAAVHHLFLKEVVRRVVVPMSQGYEHSVPEQGRVVIFRNLAKDAWLWGMEMKAESN